MATVARTDWCGDASNPGFDFESSWVWQYNYTNSWIQFTAQPYWNNTWSNHIYGWRGWHNIHDVNSTLVDYYGTTYEVSR